MRPRYRPGVIAWCLAALMVMTLPGVALAGDDPADDEPEYVVPQVLSTLPVLGAGLNVTVTRGENGEIAAVALDPAVGSTIVKESDHKVVFLLADGNTEVKVRSRGDSVQTKVSADATADVTGPGSWSADVFGTGLVTVSYTVSFDGNAPIITIDGVTVPAGVVSEIGDPKMRVDDDGEESSFRIKVRLTSGEETAKVTLAARTEVDEDDGTVEVRLGISLSDVDRHRHRDHDEDNDGRDKSDHDDDDHGDGDRGDGYSGDHDGDRDNAGGGDND
jgi:hypothetical protein